MKSTKITLKALTYLALCIFFVRCDSEVSPTSPSPVSPNQAIRADDNPINDIDRSAAVAQSSHIPPIGDFPPLPLPGDQVGNTDFVARRFFQTR